MQLFKTVSFSFVSLVIGAKNLNRVIAQHIRTDSDMRWSNRSFAEGQLEA